MGDFTPDEPTINAHHDRAEIRALVTGFAPFHSRYPVNSSWSIASSLPNYLPATATCPPIKLIVPAEPIMVAYSIVTKWEQQWMDLEDYDLVLHIGLAAGRKFFTVEQQSTRTPYWLKADVLGEIFSKDLTEKTWPSAIFPEVLTPTFDCQDVWRRWRDNVDLQIDLRPSDNPGNYLCGFIYYSSMAWYLTQGSKERPVLFLHCPDLPTQDEIAGGRDVAVGLLRAMAESRQKRNIQGTSRHHNEGMFESSVFQPRTANVEVPIVKEADEIRTLNGEDMVWTYTS